MTYAEEVAHKAIDGARRCEFAAGGRHSEACRAAAKAINAAIERCAQEAENTDGVTPEERVGARVAAARIRALAAPPAGVGAEAPPWDPKNHANHPASYCEICQSHGAPSGTGGRR